MFNINGLREEFSFFHSIFKKKYKEERYNERTHAARSARLFVVAVVVVVVVVTALVMTASHSLGCSTIATEDRG